MRPRREVGGRDGLTYTGAVTLGKSRGRRVGTGQVGGRQGRGRAMEVQFSSLAFFSAK